MRGNADRRFDPYRIFGCPGARKKRNPPDMVGAPPTISGDWYPRMIRAIRRPGGRILKDGTSGSVLKGRSFGTFLSTRREKYVQLDSREYKLREMAVSC